MTTLRRLSDFTETRPAPVVVSAVRTGAKDAMPFAAGLVPFSLAIGGASAAAGMTAFESIFAASVLMAGTAQLAATDVIASGGAMFATVTVVILVNLRFVLYGSGVARWFSDVSVTKQLLMVFAVVDATFLLCQERFTAGVDLAWRQRYYLTITGSLVAVFLLCQIVGYQLGAGLPEGLGLGLAAPLAFGGMLAKSVKGHDSLIAAAMAAVVVIFGSSLLGAAALPAAAGLGVFAGMKSAGMSFGDNKS